MAKYRLTYTVLVFALLGASCTQEEINRPGNMQKGRIEFSASLPEVTSRATELTAGSLDDLTVSSFILGASSEKPYFLDKTFTRNATTGMFVSYDPACVWPNNNDLIRFVAFAPSCDEMRQVGSFAKSDFTLGVADDGAYKFTGVKVAADIADQFDFVTAIGSGKLWDNEETPVKLQFHHQFSRIELKAFGASKSYNLEIAGIRIGGVATEGVFSFVAQPDADANDPAAAGVWESVSKDRVEYIYRPGDRIVVLDKSEVTPLSADKSVSIMGSRVGGDKAYDNSAMLIPNNNTAWAYKDNAANGDNHADGMYFSVLMRVTDITPYKPEDNPLAYPYPDGSDNAEGMEVIYLAVDDQGDVKARLYRDGDDYFTDESCTESYNGDAEVKAFGWAALPVEDTWKPGYVYTYTLDYTNGIGLRDPRDSKPGEPIISDKVLINVDVSDWKTTENKDISVPRK